MSLVVGVYVGGGKGVLCQETACSELFNASGTCNHGTARGLLQYVHVQSLFLRERVLCRSTSLAQRLRNV